MNDEAFVAFDEAGRILDWNTSAQQILGWSGGDAKGRNIAKLIPDFDLKGMPTTGTGPTYGQRLELAGRHRGGHLVPLEVTLWAVGGPDNAKVTFAAFLRDATERQQIEEQLQRLGGVVYSSDYAIMSMSLEGTILTWNQGAHRIYGYLGMEMIGQPFSKIVHRGCHEDLSHWLYLLGCGTSVQQLEAVGLDKNGASIDVALTISPIRDRVEIVTGASIVVRDITKQRWMAATLESTLASLEDALKQSQESEARCRRFLADAAHQLRTPITGIQACAETVLRGALGDQREDMLMGVVRETSRAAKLITGLLQMARLDQGEVLIPVACDVVGLCKHEAARAQALAPELRVTVRTELLHDERPELDAAAVREALSNLLDNARRYAIRDIELSLSVADGIVEIGVFDDGPGLPKGLEARAFERFVTLDAKSGSGLGLAIARATALAHGGDLTYEKGAFVLRLRATRGLVECGGASRPGPLPQVGPVARGAMTA